MNGCFIRWDRSKTIDKMTPAEVWSIIKQSLHWDHDCAMTEDEVNIVRLAERRMEEIVQKVSKKKS
jgi:hypothetical protein